MVAQRIPDTEEDLKYCNCAQCKCILLGDSLKEWYFTLPKVSQGSMPEPVNSRIMGRPYCARCVRGCNLKAKRARIHDNMIKQRNWIHRPGSQIGNV